MAESDQEDIYYQGGYDSDADIEWLPPGNKKNRFVK